MLSTVYIHLFFVIKVGNGVRENRKTIWLLNGFGSVQMRTHSIDTIWYDLPNSSWNDDNFSRAPFYKHFCDLITFNCTIPLEVCVSLKLCDLKKIFRPTALKHVHQLTEPKVPKAHNKSRLALSSSYVGRRQKSIWSHRVYSIFGCCYSYMLTCVISVCVCVFVRDFSLCMDRELNCWKCAFRVLCQEEMTTLQQARTI